MDLIFDSYVTLSKEEFLVHLQEDSKKGDVYDGNFFCKALLIKYKGSLVFIYNKYLFGQLI